MDKTYVSPFASAEGESVYKRAESTVIEYGMDALIDKGVLIGLSGGADSVLLLHFLVEYRRRHRDFPILAVHINHSIRGDEALRDEEFSKKCAESLGVEFLSLVIDVPKIAQETSVGLEEAARNVRYSEFAKIIESRNDIDTIAVAHNATDNLETVIFNIMRGAGVRGGSGISPIRGKVIRPLIDIPKSEIVNLLKSADVEYVIDSTNLSSDYTRNYIRNNVVGALGTIFSSPESAASRFSRNMRCDDSFIESYAMDFLGGRSTVTAEELMSLHPAPFARVIRLLAQRTNASPEHTHIVKIYSLLDKGDFSYSLPGGARFVSERGMCRIISSDNQDVSYRFEVEKGINVLGGFDADIILSDEKISSNIYKISTQANLSSAIIDGELYVRSRCDGDTIRYGGHTHKIKKIFTDLKIPTSEKNSIPLLCDSRGVLWVPGVAVRDDSVPLCERKDLFVMLGIGKDVRLADKRMRCVSEYRIKKTLRENNK